MDPNQPETAQPLESPLPSPAVALGPGDAVVLNVLSPSSEVPGGRITFPRIHLDTKLSQLKTRLRNVLQAAPAPERQRLIYRGHALLNADATLRQILRPQGSTEAHSDIYTLHLVLPPGDVPAQSVLAPAPFAAHTPPPAGLPQPPMPPGVLNGPPNIHGNQLPHQVLAQAQASQMMLQNQLNLLHQQLAGHAQQHQQVHTPHRPGIPGVNMPNGMHVTYQMNQHGQPGQQTQMPPGFGLGNPNAAVFEAMMQQQQQQQMPHPAVAGHQPMPGPGQPMATPINAGMPETQIQDNAATANDNEANANNASQQLPVTTRVQESTGPQGQRIRTIVQETVNMTYTSRRGTPRPATQPSATAPPNPFAANMPGMNVPHHTQSPPPAPQAPQSHTQAIAHTPLPIMMSPPMPSVSAGPFTTLAWVLSSPNGPEALLFAPGHGYFRSTPQSILGHAAPATNSALEQGPNPVAVAQDRAAPPQPGQAAGPLAVARLPHPNAIPAAQAAEENDFFNFIVGRGWLFLRMYVFTFFISEANTWRRYALLAVATLICMLPRDNFLQRVMTQIRTHIDTLIGPPTAPRRDGAAVAVPANGAAPAPGDTQPPAYPTPAENAARLVREHEARHPNMFRDALFRAERAAAMFLASLVPGVGERHVRAREDLRRDAERLLNERRAREEAERAQVQTEADATQVGSSEAGSTAAEAADATGEAREGTVQAQVVETGP